jgi:hypothetical protein
MFHRGPGYGPGLRFSRIAAGYSQRLVFIDFAIWLCENPRQQGQVDP